MRTVFGFFNHLEFTNVVEESNGVKPHTRQRDKTQSEENNVPSGIGRKEEKKKKSIYRAIFVTNTLCCATRMPFR